jgi:hypothetical protein
MNGLWREEDWRTEYCKSLSQVDVSGCDGNNMSNIGLPLLESAVWGFLFFLNNSWIATDSLLR